MAVAILSCARVLKARYPSALVTNPSAQPPQTALSTRGGRKRSVSAGRRASWRAAQVFGPQAPRWRESSRGCIRGSAAVSLAADYPNDSRHLLTPMFQREPLLRVIRVQVVVALSHTLGGVAEHPR